MWKRLEEGFQGQGNKAQKVERLLDKLGDLAWAVVRYLGRPGLRRNTMPVVKNI